MSFENKVVIITDASSGIGAATAVLFCKERANVVLVGRNETRLNNVAAHCVTRHLILKADVSNEEEAKSIVDQTIKEFGKIDILVNNAGLVRYGSVFMGDILSAFDEVMATNVRAVIHIIYLCFEHLVKSKGNIVNVSSIEGLFPSSPVMLPYCMSKAALNIFTESLALELGEYGVRVNAVSPGPVKTNLFMNAGIIESSFSWKIFEDSTVLKRVGEPEEIADLIVFLASDKARSITGSNFVSDNGLTLKR